MSIATKKAFVRGITLRPDDVAVDSIEGEIKIALTAKKLQVYLDGALRSVVTETQTQTLTNKTIDADSNTISNLELDNLKAGVLVTSTTLAAASDLNVPSSLAVKTYIDNQILTEDDASEIAFTPVGNIVATNVQTMGQELDADLSTEITRATAAELILTNGLAAHLADTADAHDASAISFDPATAPSLSSTDVQDAIITLDEDITDHVSQAAGAHAGTAIANTPSGNLAATTVQAALNELQTEVDTLATSAALSAHISDTTTHGTTGDIVGTSDAQALTTKTIVVASNTITTAASGNLVATELNAALAELQTDIDTRATAAALSAHESDTSTHGVTTVAGLDEVQVFTNKTLTAPVINSPTGIVKGDVGLGNVDNTSDANKPVSTATQTALDLKAAGAASSTDNHLARFDGATGKILQDGSTAVLSDAGILSGLTGVTSSGDISSTGKLVITGLTQEAVTSDGSTTGANVTIAAMDNGILRLSNASLTSIDMIASPISGQSLTIINQTGAAIVINNDTGGTAANRILTGTSADLTLADQASILLKYDATETRWMVIGGSGSSAGGASLPDTFVQLTGSELIGTWSSGDNATFLGGGTLAGTFAYDTSTPLQGTQSYKYTQAASSLDDYLASPVQSVPLRFRGNAVTCYFPYTYDGGSSDIEPVIWDVTNSAKLTTSTNLLPSTGTNASIYKVNVTIPLTCTQIQFGFQTKILNSGKILAFDDVQVSSDTTKYAEVALITDWQAYTPTFTGFGTATSVGFQWRRVGSNIDIRGKFTTGTATATEARISLPNSYSSAGTSIIPSIIGTGQVCLGVSGAVALEGLIEPSTSYLTFGIQSSGSAGLTKVNGSTGFSNSSIYSVTASVPIAGLSSSNPQIITPVDTFYTDTASLVYASSSAYTPATLVNAPVGTFITHTYAATSNTVTQTTTAPTQTTSDMNINGIQLTGRAYSALSTSTAPCRFDIQIGPNLKGTELLAFASTTKNDPISYVYRSGAANLTTQSGTDWGYDPDTGVFTINAGTDITTLSTTRNVGVRPDTGAAQTAGYFTINASKSPALVGVPQVQPRIATISDQKASGTASGTFTSGAWQTRTLNTLVDDTGIVTSLASNQFTLPAGTYYIDAVAPAYRADGHVAKLRNITDGADTLIGGSAHASNSGSAGTAAVIKGTFTITSAKVFEVQHRCTTTSATLGFGVSNTFGVNEVYAQAKITRIK